MPRSFVIVLLLGLAAGSARAQAPAAVTAGEPALELGAGVDFTALGSYDVGEALGGAAERNDLGPATLGVFLCAQLPVDPVQLGGEVGLAVGGLVRTDERYFGSRSNVGSTLAAWLRVKAGWTAITRPGTRLQLGGALAIERFSEATGLGNVRLDSSVIGAWAALKLGRGVIAELHADAHVPYRGNIGDDMSGNPDGVFFAAGVRLAYVLGFGSR